jgi:hypothetical protein
MTFSAMRSVCHRAAGQLSPGKNSKIKALTEARIEANEGVSPKPVGDGAVWAFRQCGIARGSALSALGLISRFKRLYQNKTGG